MILLPLLLAACGPAKDGDAVSCGAGTHLEGSECVPDDDSGDTGDSATDTGATDTGESDTGDSGIDTADSGDSDTDSGDTDTADTSDSGLDTSDSGLDTSDTSPPDADLDGYPSDVDCDDTNPAIHPDAAETCGDGVDDDCDGRDATCGYTGAADVDAVAAQLSGVNRGDRAGIALAGGADVNGDGYADVVVGASGVDEGATDGGGAYVVSGPITGDVSLSRAAALVYGEDEDLFLGAVVALPGDTDGDGYADVLVGYDRDSGNRAGAWLFLGPVTGTISASTADAEITEATAGDETGIAVASLGDIDGDHLADFAIGARASSHSGSGAGAVFVYSGPDAVSGAASNATAKVYGVSVEQFGRSVSGAGDVDGDGLDDLVGGASDPYDGYSKVWLFHGPLAGESDLRDADATFFASDFRGQGHLGLYPGDLAGGEDLDGDGREDLVLADATWSTSSDDGTGALFVVTGIVDGDTDLASAPRVEGDYPSLYFGQTVASPGDLDGDGHADIVGAAIGGHAHGSNTGAGYLFYGPLSGTLSVADADARFDGPTGNAQLYTVAAGGDLDADGRPDLLLGARQATGDSASSGAAWVLTGTGP